MLEFTLKWLIQGGKLQLVCKFKISINLSFQNKNIYSINKNILRDILRLGLSLNYFLLLDNISLYELLFKN